MKVSSYIDLYNRIMQDGDMRPWEAIHVIGKLRRMSKDLLKALYVWLNGGVPQVEINGVSYAELVNDEGLNWFQALLMLDWLRRDPLAAATFMQTERMRKPFVPLSPQEAEIAQRALDNVKALGVNLDLEKRPQSNDELAAEELSDIEIRNEDAEQKTKANE